MRMTNRTTMRNADRLIGWRDQMRVPIIAAPMFLASTPDMVIAQCISGIIGTLPALNARHPHQLESWLEQISGALSRWNIEHPARPAAPFGVNLVVHRSNGRLHDDLSLCETYRVPLVISSMGAREEVNHRVHAYGGVTLHDVISQAHARKAIQKGATGLIAVAAGAGGHAGAVSPFALVEETREWFDGPLALAGAIGSGRAIAAARTLGADFAYVGSAFIATVESGVSIAQKRAMIEASAADIVYTPAFSGIHANYLSSSIVAAGMDPNHLPSELRRVDASNPSRSAKTWSEIWGCGQGVGSVVEIEPVAAVIARLATQYEIAGASSGMRTAGA